MDFIGSNFLEISDIIGTVAFAVSGIILSIRRDLDLMGTYIVSILSCSGGGIIRDVLLNQQPALLFSTNTFMIVLCLTVLFKCLKKGDFIETLEGTFIFRVSDSLGLVAFAMIGAQKAIYNLLPLYSVLTMALLSSVGGGLLRDALLSRVNTTLTSGFYGSISILVGLLVYASSYFNLPIDYALPIIFCLGVITRLAVIRYRVNLAKIR